MVRRHPFVLIILDGWGEAPEGYRNPLKLKNLPFWSMVKRSYPFLKLRASGIDVGLPKGQAGNSEAGHMNLGAGRIVPQDAVVISKSIANGTFFKNKALTAALAHVKKTGGSFHLMGIVSGRESPHMDPDHVTALTRFAKNAGIKKVWFHAFTDGRDSYYKSGIAFIENLHKEFRSLLEVVTVMGRLYLDRKKNWERTHAAYSAMVDGEGICVKSAEDAVRSAYARGETDEFIHPSVVVDAKGNPKGLISDTDAVIFFNLRSDRARQLAKIFVQKDFERINNGAPKRSRVLKRLFFVAMTDFGPDLSGITTAYPSRYVTNTLPFVLKDTKQLYVAESEKFAHITYFFNGGYARTVAGEDREVIASPDVTSYRDTPGMRTPEITNRIIGGLKNYDFTAGNFSSPDMVGHTGDMPAAKEALTIVDANLSRLADAVLRKNGTLVITADHGNVEEMLERDSGKVDTRHSANLVPFVIIDKRFLGKRMRVMPQARLADVAPTLLALMGRHQPREMNGRNLLSPR